MKPKDLTWAPGTSDKAAEHEGTPLIITFIVEGKNPFTGDHTKEIKMTLPHGWNIDALMNGLMYVVITEYKLTPTKIHCLSVELNGAKLN